MYMCAYWTNFKYSTVWLDLIFKISVVYTGSKVNKGMFLL